MAAPVLQVQNIADFRGGLNLRGNDQTLAPNEVPYVVNMDHGDRGGMATRRGIKPFSATDAGAAPKIIGLYETSAVAAKYMVELSGKIQYTTGTTYTDSTKTRSGVTMAVMNGRALFGHDGTTANVAWDGTTWTDMVETYTTFDAPGTDDGAPSRVVAVWANHTWAGGTYESAVRQGSRLRWSHPAKMDAWRTEDFMDVDKNVSGDDITALVPFGEQLLIFKRNSMYSMHGSSWEDFYIKTISSELGTPGPFSAVAQGGKCWFWSWDGGIYMYDGRKITYLFDKLFPLIDDDLLTDGSDVRVMWANNRLWVALDELGTRCAYILDGDGGWTKYTLPITAMHWATKISGANFPLITLASRNYLYQADDTTQIVDNFGGGTTASVGAIFKTNWLRGREVAVRKRWRRPYLSAQSSATSTLRLRVYYDYDGTVVRRSIDFPITAVAGAGAVWDTSPGAYASLGEFHKFGRSTNLGLAYVVQVEFSMPNDNVYWVVDSMTVPYKEKPIK